MTKPIKMLAMDSPTFVTDLAAAMGVKPGDKISIITPQFERTDGIDVALPSFSPEDWASLYTKDHDELIAMGLGVWEDTDAGKHYLFPKEWYSIIPEGLAVKSISGDIEPFQPGVTDNDYRFGCLAYGFFKPKEGDTANG